MKNEQFWFSISASLQTCKGQRVSHISTCVEEANMKGRAPQYSHTFRKTFQDTKAKKPCRLKLLGRASMASGFSVTPTKLREATGSKKKLRLWNRKYFGFRVHAFKPSPKGEQIRLYTGYKPPGHKTPFRNALQSSTTDSSAERLRGCEETKDTFQDNGQRF